MPQGRFCQTGPRAHPSRLPASRAPAESRVGTRSVVCASSAPAGLLPESACCLCDYVPPSPEDHTIQKSILRHRFAAEEGGAEPKRGVRLPHPPSSRAPAHPFGPWQPSCSYSNTVPSLPAVGVVVILSRVVPVPNYHGTPGQILPLFSADLLTWQQPATTSDPSAPGAVQSAKEGTPCCEP